MALHQKIADARNRKGLTQEELAALAKVNVRTIQRIESGQTVPRAYTLRAIASALGLPGDGPFTEGNLPVAATDNGDTDDFLRLFCLSCFSYLVLPFVHFLVPAWLLKRRKGKGPAVRHFASRVVRGQQCWVVATMLVFLLVLLFNFLQASFAVNPHFISYLWPFFVMYTVNLFIIVFHLRAARLVANAV